MKSIFELLSTNLTSGQFESLKSHYSNKKIIVTGGASFIGSNLVDILTKFNTEVIVIDDLSSGRQDNLNSSPSCKFIQGDLRNLDFARKTIAKSDVVFHLAAIHGGRGFIETFKRDMLANLALDNNVFSSAAISGVKMVVHASSACAYPVTLQENEISRNLLAESQASMEDPGLAFADGVYGWTKLIGEYQLANHCSVNGMRGRSARIFTAYGERENESHAAIALIAKALLKADPYPIWGNGEQTRNFTHVADTVLGLLLLGHDDSELIFDVFNIGTSSHVKVIDFVNEIFKQIEWKPGSINFQLDKPTGVASRASDNKKMLSRFGWEPKIDIPTGVSRTIHWYKSIKDRPLSLGELEKKLSSR